jgi:hypothetical protein
MQRDYFNDGINLVINRLYAYQQNKTLNMDKSKLDNTTNELSKDTIITDFDKNFEQFFNYYNEIAKETNNNIDNRYVKISSDDIREFLDLINSLETENKGNDLVIYDLIQFCKDIIAKQSACKIYLSEKFTCGDSNRHKLQFDLSPGYVEGGLVFWNTWYSLYAYYKGISYDTIDEIFKFFYKNSTIPSNGGKRYSRQSKSRRRRSSSSSSFHSIHLGKGKTNKSLCLDVEGGSHGKGARFIAWPCHGGPNQKFRVLKTRKGRKCLQAKHSRHCLDEKTFQQVKCPK